MGHSISKPEWHAPQQHHQVVVEPASLPKKQQGVRWWSRSRRDDRGDDLHETYNIPAHHTPRIKQQHSLFNRSPNTSKKLPRVPVAQVIVHRPSERYRTRDYRTRLQDVIHRSPSPIPVSVPVAKHPPTIGGRAFQPPRALALMDVGSRLAEKGKEAKREFKESLRAERERRFNDTCREYAALKVVTEQDVYKRIRREQKREAKRQREYTV